MMWENCHDHDAFLEALANIASMTGGFSVGSWESKICATAQAGLRAAALAALPQPDVDSTKLVEEAFRRLDRLEAAVLPGVMPGDLDTIRAALMVSRAALPADHHLPDARARVAEARERVTKAMIEYRRQHVEISWGRSGGNSVAAYEAFGAALDAFEAACRQDERERSRTDAAPQEKGE